MDPTTLLALSRCVELLDELQSIDCISTRKAEGKRRRRTFSTSSRDLGSMGALLSDISGPITIVFWLDSFKRVIAGI